MRINLVMGFSLPMPPDAGGSMERAWQQIAIDFATRGHLVTIISRCWTGWPNLETQKGIVYRRIPGFETSRHRYSNILKDFVWSLRAFFELPAADITIVNCVCLPAWLGWIRKGTGKLIVMPSRMPSGQFRFYRKIDCILAASTSVSDEIIAENRSLESSIQIVGFPINWSFFARPRIGKPAESLITIGYVGRIHKEKGLDLLVDAIEILSKDTALPKWKLYICGPKDIAQGGSGETYATMLERRLSRFLCRDCFAIKPPSVSVDKLLSTYQDIDIFCYPSLSRRGEVFGVNVAESMAAQAIPVVSQLPCFTEYIQKGSSGIIFDHTAPDAREKLAASIKELLLNPSLRNQLSEGARSAVYRYDYPLFAERLLADFATIAISSK